MTTREAMSAALKEQTDRQCRSGRHSLCGHRKVTGR